MNSPETIKEELAALNSSLSPVKKPVFSVPEGYFENFAATVLVKINEQQAVAPADEIHSLSPLLSGLSRQTPYSVPDNYFSSLAIEIPVLIGNDPLPSILQEAARKNAYDVPEGYFDNLSNEVLRRVSLQAPAKVVSITNRGWMRLAAAAVITGAIALASIFYFSRDAAAPESLPESWVAAELKGVSDSDLEEFVQTADVASKRPASSSKASAEVRKLFQDVSDRELDDFLAEVPNDDEELIMFN